MTHQPTERFTPPHEDYREWLHFEITNVQMFNGGGCRESYARYYNRRKNSNNTMEKIERDLMKDLRRKTMNNRGPWVLDCTLEEAIRELIRRLEAKV